MTFWLSGGWFHSADPEGNRYYVGRDGQIYDQQGNFTGYELKTQTFISGPGGDFAIDDRGNVMGDPFG